MILDNYMSPAHLFPHLKLGIYRIFFKVQGKKHLPAYTGSKWRGLWGKSLKELVCPWIHKDCQKCLVGETCAVFRLFHKQSEEPGFSTPPKTYMLTPVIQDSNKLSIDMSVFSPSEDLLPQMMEAWNQMGENGFGFEKKMAFESAYQYHPERGWQMIDDCAHKSFMLERRAFYLMEYLKHAQSSPRRPWRFNINTPLRLRKNGKNICEADMGFAFTALGNRLSIMNRESGGSKLTKDEWVQLKSFLLQPGEVFTQEHWFDWKRFSNLQNKYIPMGGLIGKILVIPEQELQDIWWLWWQIACLVHLGKGVSMGMGEIEFVGY